MQFDLRGKMVYYMPRFFEIRFVRTSSLSASGPDVY